MWICTKVSKLISKELRFDIQEMKTKGAAASVPHMTGAQPPKILKHKWLNYIIIFGEFLPWACCWNIWEDGATFFIVLTSSNPAGCPCGAPVSPSNKSGNAAFLWSWSHWLINKCWEKNIWLEISHTPAWVCMCVLYTEYQKTQSSEDIFGKWGHFVFSGLREG